MAGHSKWKQIKHKKETADQKRGALFSKLLKAISVAAKENPDTQFNPRLRTAVEKAKENLVPNENIERAIKRASEDKNLEELIVEAYGPEGAAIIVEAITDSRNRTISEIKKILGDHNAKLAEPGSVQWAFEKTNGGWQAKFKQEISPDAKEQLKKLVNELKEHDDAQNVYVNSNF